ncbi:MAG: DNA-binding protein WhiA [Malacoplasma sp.]|nr:DNA-binding protein WhiA [Malacoplasma sp.]
MTFSQKIKEELCRNEYDWDQKKAILSAFFKNNAHIDIQENLLCISFSIKNLLIARFILSLVSEIYENNGAISYEKQKSGKDNKSITLNFYNGFEIVVADLFLDSDPWDWLVNKKIRSSYLAGLFLSSGSVNNPNSSNYHFELKIHNEMILNVVNKIFKQLKIVLLQYKRNNVVTTYLKKSEAISDILKLMGAIESMYEYEDKRITRDFKNQNVRLNNLDISNLKKTVVASKLQVDNIHKIKNSRFYNQLSEKERIYCELRLKNPQASFYELVVLFKQNYNIEITKSGINHIVRKIKELIKLFD